MYRITLTAGTFFDGTGKMLTNDEQVEGLTLIRQRLAQTAGGYTESDTYGGWIKDGKLIQEPGKRWIVLADTDREAESLAQFAGSALHQNAVALEVESLAEARIVETA